MTPAHPGRAIALAAAAFMLCVVTTDGEAQFGKLKQKAKQATDQAVDKAASDAVTYYCSASGWASHTSSSPACINPSYPYCKSATLGTYVQARTCVQAASDRLWYQCTANGVWSSAPSAPTYGTGPLGNCSSVRAL